MDEFLTVRPEGKFAHYLMMAAALGETDFAAPGVQYGDYENSIGTSQVHVWFDRPAAGWTRKESCRMTEYRRILLDGAPVQIIRHGDELVAADGRVVGVDEAIHLPPCEPTKIIAVHLNYDSRTQEFMTKLPPAPTYFHKPITALNSHKGAVVRPERCKWLNYEGEIVIVIGRTCRNVSPEEAGDYIAGYTVGNDYGLHDFRDTDAGSMLRVKGVRHARPRSGPGSSPAGTSATRASGRCVNGDVKQDGDDRRDGVGHALPRRRHRPHHHAGARRPPVLRHAGLLPHRLPRRRRRGRGRGPRHAEQHDRRRARCRSATTSARSRPRARRSSPPRWAATGSSAASAPRRRTCTRPPSRRR